MKVFQVSWFGNDLPYLLLAGLGKDWSLFTSVRHLVIYFCKDCDHAELIISEDDVVYIL